MKRLLSRLWRPEWIDPNNQREQELSHTCAGRLVNGLTFFIVIACLGLWFATFVLVTESLDSGSLPAFTIGDLTCITFFGGLVAAVLVGALAGNFLRRAFWHWLVRRQTK